MRKAHDYCPSCKSYDTNIEALCLVEPMKCNQCGHSFQPEVVSDSLLCYGLPEYNGWKAYYEFPGFISYRRPGQDVGLIVTSDWDGDENTLLISVVDEFGEQIPKGLGVRTSMYEHWPSEGRTSDAMFELIKPKLDEVTGLVRRHPCTTCGAILVDEIADECSNPGEGCCPPAAPPAELTAETITDEQIRELRDETAARLRGLTTAIKSTEEYLAKLRAEEDELAPIMIATGVALRINGIMEEHADFARNRCAEILNARKGKR